MRELSRRAAHGSSDLSASVTRPCRRSLPARSCRCWSTFCGRLVRAVQDHGCHTSRLPPAVAEGPVRQGRHRCMRRRECAHGIAAFPRWSCSRGRNMTRVSSALPAGQLVKWVEQQSDEGPHDAKFHRRARHGADGGRTAGQRRRSDRRVARGAAARSRIRGGRIRAPGRRGAKDPGRHAMAPLGPAHRNRRPHEQRNHDQRRPVFRAGLRANRRGELQYVGDERRAGSLVDRGAPAAAQPRTPGAEPAARTVGRCCRSRMAECPADLDADHRAALLRRGARERVAARAAAAAGRSRPRAHRDPGSPRPGRHTGDRHL